MFKGRLTELKHMNHHHVCDWIDEADIPKGTKIETSRWCDTLSRADANVRSRVLNRVVNWNGDGFTWEADPKLTEKQLNMLNLSGGQGVLTPGGKDIGKDDRVIDSELEYLDAKLAQAAAGLEQYIALGRSDVASRSSCSFAWSESLVS